LSLHEIINHPTKN